MKILESLINTTYNAYNRLENRDILKDPELRIQTRQDDKSSSQPKSKQTQKVLSFQEASTLHMLFGANKPEEMNLYGRNKIQQVNKGYLVDVMG
ncbi:MAG TPA: hypothetical protein ENN84_06595 [Candidatus Marinimicrobia bacterium]|nr:hypothetical protein [Candidatus Neomarinimicrobiota bacterium]